MVLLVISNYTWIQETSLKEYSWAFLFFFAPFSTFEGYEAAAVL